MVHFGKKTHAAGISGIVNVAAVAAARKQSQPLVGWTAIWIKAVALAGRDWPELRTAYLPYPWPRMYVHPHTVASVVVERTWNGSLAVFVDKLSNPEARSLAEIDTVCKALKKLPIESVGGFRHLIRITRLPLLVRRMLWSFALQWSGSVRAKYMGTFSVIALPARQFEVLQNWPPVSTLYFGTLEPNGEMTVQFIGDHRVMDAMSVYRMARAIEAIMNNDIVAELTARPSAP